MATFFTFMAVISVITLAAQFTCYLRYRKVSLQFNSSKFDKAASQCC